MIPIYMLLKSLFRNKKLVIIGESHQVNEIGLSLKLILYSFPTFQDIVVGSSAFKLQNRINQSMTGRKFESLLYPFSFTAFVNKRS